MRQLLLASTAACAIGLAGPAVADVTLLFWPGPESEAMQSVIDAFNEGQGAQAGFSVNQLLFSRQGYFDKQIADLAAGTTEFDLSLVTTYTLGRYAPFLEPLDGCLPEDVAAAYAPVALDSLSFDGAIYGVPTDISLHFTYYRSDLIEQLLHDAAWQARYAEISERLLGTAMTPKAPDEWTWDDYVAVSLFFTQSINPDSPTRYGTALQLKNLIFNIMLWQAAVVSNGGNWMADDGAVTVASDATRQGLDIFSRIVENEATPPGSVGYEFGEANQAFGNGMAATMLQWNAAFNIVNSADEMPQTAGKVGIAPLPAGPEGHKTHVHSLGIGMNRASENKEQGGIFLAYLASPEAMEIYARAGGTPPSPAILSAMAESRPEFPAVGAYADDFGFVVNGGTADYAVPVYEVLAKHFSAVWAGNETADDAMAAAQAEVTAIVGR